ncbi:ABC transporter permease [Anoxybacterium hadale]|uniref:ABC transporter permease n=1 Tax=Anoxybacterium hadale TaxID=3408580 RepID=A0ACD1AG75_9FIRM|nr:ABC transporter permease [Clostridiales bacterium]
MSMQAKQTEQSFDLALFTRKYGILMILAFMIVFLLIASPTFRTLQNTINVLNQISINGIIAIGMTFIIISGGIDLSIGSMIAVASVVTGAVLAANPSNVVFAVALASAACGLIGLFNGYIISKFDMFPFVVTLGTQLIFRGVAYVISDGKSYVLTSNAFKEIGQGKLLGVIPYSIIVLISIAFIGLVLLSRTKYGQYVYAIGGNLHTAVASGVNVFKIKLLTYMMMGVFTGIAGVILTSRVNAGQPSIGVGYELDAIAAVVIGGSSLNGGIGTIPGTVIGILMIGVINNGMNLMGVSSFYQQIVKGFIILGAVILDIMISRRKSK